jgi:hypothetical protein
VSLVTVTQPDGSRVLSWRDASGQVVRRVRALPDGREITLFDGLETAAEPEIRVTELPPIRREDQRRAFLSGASAEELLRVLSAQPVSAVEDRFTLRQILANDQIRWLMPSLALDAVTFDTGSATLGVEEIRALDTMGRTLRRDDRGRPAGGVPRRGPHRRGRLGHPEPALSDRRAETVAMLLTSYYEVPPENLLVQGFGEQDLRVPTLAASPREPAGRDPADHAAAALTDLADASGGRRPAPPPVVSRPRRTPAGFGDREGPRQGPLLPPLRLRTALRMARRQETPRSPPPIPPTS